MSYEEKLRGYREARNAVWLQFLQAYARDFRILFLFFEDLASQALYLPVVQRFFPNVKIRSLPCRTKRDVLSLQVRISSDGPMNRRTLFFVDRDHDDFVGTPQTSTQEIFYTTFYSIENYLVTPDVVREILHQKLCVDQAVCDIDAVVANFSRQHKVFLALLRPFMIWAIFHRRTGTVNLGNVNLARIIELDANLRPRKRRSAFLTFRLQSGVSGTRIAVRQLAQLC